MRVLSVHNFYRMPGGEDQVCAAETALLRHHGHEVTAYTRDNQTIQGGSRLTAAAAAVWSRAVYRDVRRLCRAGRFDVCHVHNFFPLVSPSAYYAARRERVPVVQTLHNYRLLCPAATFFRGGKACESCLGKALPWPAVRHGCYRSDRLASGCVAAMIAVHRAAGTWRQAVDLYIALTEFARRKFIEGGLPEERIVVKPNFVYPDPGPGAGAGSYALFAGRLSPEKDVRTLIRAAARVGTRLRLKIAGEGPDRDHLTRMAEGLSHIEFLGRQPRERVLELMKDAAMLVAPSACFEGFGMVIAEAFAVGLPVVASRLGTMAEIVDDSRTGLLFRVGDSEDLAAKIEQLLADPGKRAAMRRQARAEFEAKYGAEVNYRRLGRIYQLAIERHRGSR